MRLKSLNQLKGLRRAVMTGRRLWLKMRYGVVVPKSSSVSTAACLNPGRPGSITIGPDTLIAFKVIVMTWDDVSCRDRPVHIGARCFIGGASVITPGVTIGDGSIVGAGSVVFEDVPPRSIVAGNPARVVRSDISTGKMGRLDVAAENTARLWKID